MIEPIRDYILAAEGATDDFIEAEELEDKLENEVRDRNVLVLKFCYF